MKIRDLIKTTATGLSLPFGHGARSYANLASDTLEDGVDLDPATGRRLWMYPHQEDGKVTKSNALDFIYSVLFDIHEQCPFDEKPTIIEDKLAALNILARKFIFNMARNPAVTDIVSFRVEPLYHEFDDNYIGQIVKIDFKIDELIDYSCLSQQ